MWIGPDNSVRPPQDPHIARPSTYHLRVVKGHPEEVAPRRVRSSGLDNADVADALERVGDLLEAQEADSFRVRAWRGAAAAVRQTPRPLHQIFAAEGRTGLRKLPGIGKSLASAIEELLHTGRLAMLDRLEGQISPEDLFTTVPGIGETLARRIHAELGIDTLEDLELAAHDGRLEAMPGFGARRTRLVRETLAAILSRSTRRRARQLRERREVGGAEAAPGRPSVETILAVDAEYRWRAGAGELRTIAPRRFNPHGDAWLPILHAERDGWSFTALYSNTARAHELGKTRDWVVVYFERDGDEDQCTVVTEHAGTLAGHRVVRGREDECRDGYRR
jgi:DNA polymerase (family X)